jgi:uncharacterized protein (TIGR02001 family)
MSFNSSSRQNGALVFIAAGIGLLAALASPAAAQDVEIEGVVAVGSEYVGKGLGKSDGEVAVSGEIEAGFGDFHGGVFASTARLSQGSDAEVITTVGWAPEAAGFAFDFVVMNRDLPGTNPGVDANYWEYQADVSRDFGPAGARLRVNWTPDGFAATREAWWVELQGGYRLAADTKATVAVATRRAHGGADYTAWNAGVKHRLTDAVALDLRWYDTDEHALGSAYEGRLVGALSYAF